MTAPRVRALLGSTALLLVAALPVFIAPAAGAVDYPPPAIDTKPVTEPNGPMTVDGTGFTPGCAVVVSLDGTPIGTTTVAPNGTFSFNFKAPAAVGPHQVSASGCADTLTTTFRVETGGGGGGGGGLPYTGSSSTPWLVRVGVGLVAAGAVILALVRSPARRRSEKARVDA